MPRSPIRAKMPKMINAIGKNLFIRKPFLFLNIYNDKPEALSEQGLRFLVNWQSISIRIDFNVPASLRPGPVSCNVPKSLHPSR